MEAQWLLISLLSPGFESDMSGKNCETVKSGTDIQGSVSSRVGFYA